MSYKPLKIDPLDLSSRKAIGVKLPFSAGNVFNQTYQTKEAIKINLVNYFLTGKGERVLNPNFGSGLKNFLFENIVEEDIETAQEVILEEVETYFPNIVVNNLNIEASTQNNEIIFNLRYSIPFTDVEDEVVINFNV